MKIVILGTTSYLNKMIKHKIELEKGGHKVKLPVFDSHPELDELEICKFNRGIIKWCEEIHVFWDQRSIGFIFDFGMVFALNKPLKIMFLEPKTLTGVLTAYEK